MIPTVIMPVYNGEDFLQEAIDSILTQTYKEFEFIIINDASTDGTRDILSRIQDPRVKIFHLEENKGSAVARHFGIKKATGDWIILQDHDDVSLPNRIEELMKFVKKKRNIVAASSLIEGIPGKGPINQSELHGDAKFHNPINNRKLIERFRYYACPVCFGTSIIRKDAYFEVGGFNKKWKLAEDYDLFLKLQEKRPFEMVPKVLYQYRVNFESKSRKNWIETNTYISTISTNYIKKDCFGHLNRKPRFALIATKQGTDYFQKYIEPKIKLKISEYLYHDSEKNFPKVHKWVLEGKLDGLIVLDSYDSVKHIHYFEQKGLIMNKNLFHLYRKDKS